MGSVVGRVVKAGPLGPLVGEASRAWWFSCVPEWRVVALVPVLGQRLVVVYLRGRYGVRVCRGPWDGRSDPEFSCRRFASPGC